MAELPGLPHGHVLGVTAEGVVGYNCNYKNNPARDEPGWSGWHSVDGVHTGTKWQCVEFARRYWLTQFGVYLRNTKWAADIWDVHDVIQLANDWLVPLLRFPQGSDTFPRVGDYLIYAVCTEQPVGHVAVVVEALYREGESSHAIRVAEQNNDNDVMWPGPYARELRVDGSGRSFVIVDEDPIIGWMRLNFAAAHPRPAWTWPRERLLPVTGVYDRDTVLAFQRFLDTHADGDHGGMTNRALRVFLNSPRAMSVCRPPIEHVAASDGPELVMALQRFLNGVLELCVDDSTQHVCPLAVDGEWGALTTQALQRLLNNVPSAENLSGAIAVVRGC